MRWYTVNNIGSFFAGTLSLCPSTDPIKYLNIPRYAELIPMSVNPIGVLQAWGCKKKPPLINL